MNRTQRIFKLDERYRYGALWFFCGCCLLLGIIYFSLASSAPMPKGKHVDKVFHAGSYGVLMLWWLQLYRHRVMRLLLMAMFILLGVAIEVMQSFHPLRYFDVADMYANTLGVLLGMVGGYTVLGRLLLSFEQRFLGVNSVS